MLQLSVRNISVRYDEAEAVRDISLQVEKGKIVTLIGANGSGKSTILRAISGINPPSSGEIWFEGKRIDKLSPPKIVNLGISMVTEERNLFPFMTVKQNLKLGAFLRKNKNEIEEDLKDVFSRFSVLSDRKGQQAGTLSGGEQQMLAIGRALMTRPKLLMLDEPYLGLAPMLVQQIGKIISDINQRGTGVILVEQNAHMALRIAHRGYVIETGKIAMEGVAEDISHDEHVRKAYLGG